MCAAESAELGFSLQHMAYIVMAVTVIAYIVIASLVMAYIVMAYIVIAVTHACTRQPVQTGAI